jgi:hypothetical protein
MDIATHAARKLARRSSRRQFFKLLGAGSLGAGLFLTRTDVSLGAITGCVGCGGGPCNPCGSPAPPCPSLNPPWQCKSCAEGAGCPVGCHTGGEWFCCLTGGSRAGCRFRCSECNCPAGCQNPSCYCFTDLPMPCNPRLHSGDHPCTCGAEKEPKVTAGSLAA